MPPVPRPAATVILLRPEAERFSVFLVRRNRRVGFMPSAWVFPGGRVDEADAAVDPGRLSGVDEAVGRLGMDRADGVAWLAAAIRETFEESGVWLGEGNPGAAARASLNDGTATLQQVLAAHGGASTERLRPWSRWVTPENEPRRYDTRFFVAVVRDEDRTAARHDEGETVDSAWVPIDQAVARAEAGDLPMAPPTWWTLRELARLADLDEALVVERPLEPICPILRLGEGELTLLLPGHPEHADPAVDGVPPSLGFRQGRWWSEAPTAT